MLQVFAKVIDGNPVIQVSANSRNLQLSYVINLGNVSKILNLKNLHLSTAFLVCATQVSDLLPKEVKRRIQPLDTVRYKDVSFFT